MNGFKKQLIKQGWTELLADSVVRHFNILEESGKYDYMDNYRVARAGNEKEVKAYKEAADSGCCGFFDEMFWCDGEIVLYGFNYGH